MKMKRVLSILTALFLALGSLSFSAAAAETVDVSTLYKNKDVDDAWILSDAKVIDLDTVGSGTVTISEKGDWVLSGTLNGQVVVEVPEDEKVRLILNGVTIVSGEGPAVYEKQADKLIVTLAEGTVNTLTDGPAVTDEDDTIGAALYAEDDLSINGTGSLIVNGTEKHGIQSKADLIIADGDITVTAVTDGIRGRNSLLVLGGTLNVTAGGDGLTATRTDAEGKGWIVLAGGSVTVKTGDGAGAARASANTAGGFNARGRMDDWGSLTGTADSGVSQKAVKAAADLTVLDGTYVFDCADDGLHGLNVTVSGGTFDIRSGDDAMHADEQMTVNAGTVDIAQCYEGLEGKIVTVNGGDIVIISSDDGINASGGSDASGFGNWGRGGMGGEADNGGMLTVTGGTVSVTAGGDGLDSNGSILVSGGFIGVWTMSSGMEGPIDYNGTGTITGGTLITATSGMSFGGRGGGAGLSGLKTVTYPASGGAGETITLTDEAGNVLGAFTPGGSYSAVTVTSDAIGDGSGITVTGGSGAVAGGTGTDAITSATQPGNGGPFGPGRPGEGFGGGQPNDGGGNDFGRGHGRKGH